MEQEKRRYPRFVVQGVHGTMVFATQVEVLNLSMGGVAIRADRRLNIGNEYALKLDMGDHVLSLTGVVVWSVLSGLRKSGGDSTPEYSAGLKFVDVLSDRLQGLIEFIDSHKMTDEHRLTGVRFQVSAPGKAFLDSAHQLSVRLLSLSGMLIEAGHPLEPEGVYEMEISPPGLAPIRFKGRVASFFEILDEVAPRYEMGIEFKDMAPGDRSRLEAFVRQLS